MSIIPLPGPAFIAGGSGYGEIILIFVVVLLLFGPKRLPEVARMIGRAFDELRKASQEFKDQIMAIETEAHDTAREAIDAVVREGDEPADDYDDYEDYDEDADEWRNDGSADDVPADPPIDEAPSGPGADMTEPPAPSAAETALRPTPSNESEDDERPPPLAG